jgi:hypothetical protein
MLGLTKAIRWTFLCALLALAGCGKEEVGDAMPAGAGGTSSGGNGGNGGAAGVSAAGTTGGGDSTTGGVGGDILSGGSGGTEVPQIPITNLCPEDESLPRTDASLGVAVLAEGLRDPVPVKVDATSLWYTDRSSMGTALFRMPKGGGASELVAEDKTLGGVAVNDTHAFWLVADSETQLQTLKSVALDATMAMPVELATGIKESNFLVATHDNLFFADRSENILYRLPLTGGAMLEELATDITVQGMDVYDGYVYFTEFNASAAMRIPESGGVAEVLSDAHFPESIAVSADGVFYAGSFTTLESVAHAGGTSTVLAQSNDSFNSIRVAQAGDGEVFWYQGSFLDGCTHVHRVNADGSDQSVIAIPAPIGPLLEADALYFAAGDGDYFDPHGVLLRIDR